MMFNDSMSDAGAVLYLTPVRSDDAYHGTLKADAAIRPSCQPKNPALCVCRAWMQQRLLYERSVVENHE
jgi:hypothetical protein